MPEQLVLPFEVREARGRANFIVAPCNETAVRFIDRWPDWPVKAAAIYGPRGSGKSHLVQVWIARSNATCIRAPALEAVPDGPVAIEDVDSVVGAERDGRLMSLFDSGRPMLLTGARHPAEWPVVLPDLASRFAALPAFPLWEPDEALLCDLARKLFADRQLQAGETVIARMLARLPRTPDAIRDFVARLDRFTLAQRRPITDRAVSDLLDREAQAGTEK